MNYNLSQNQLTSSSHVHVMLIAFFLVCMLLTSAYAQPSGKRDLQISFNTGLYTLEKPNFYKRSGNGIQRNAAATMLINSFNVSTYESYQQYFCEGECHVTNETFTNWKTIVGRTKPIILASFTLHVGHDEYCLIKYAMQHKNLEFISGQLLKKTNDTWYFCGLDENVERVDLIMFFSLINQDFFTSVKKNRVSASPQACLTNNLNLDGQKLIDQYFDKYNPQSPCYETLNLLFEDRIQSIDDAASDEMNHYDQYFRSAGLPIEEVDYLSNLVRSYNTEMAILHFSKLSGKPVKEIIQQVPKIKPDEK